jgi:hypothetical protein
MDVVVRMLWMWMCECMDVWMYGSMYECVVVWMCECVNVWYECGFLGYVDIWMCFCVDVDEFTLLLSCVYY